MIDFAHPAAEMPLPLLITGIAGVVGYNAFHRFQSRYPGHVFGMRQIDNARLTGPGVLALNAEDRDGLARAFDRHKFAAVLDCAGNCALRACELDPALAWRINVEGVRNLVSQTVPRRVRLVHLSVDLVFSGERDGGYLETDPPDPVTMYGKTMVVGEQVVREADPAACTLRISLPMGVSFNGHAGAIDWISSRFKKSRPATLYLDEVRTPTYVDCLSSLGETVLKSELAGLYHAGGPRRMSLYEIAQVINRAGGYEPERLLGIPRHEAGPIPPRAGNVSMNSDKLIAALGTSPIEAWPRDGHLVPTDRDWHRRRRAGEPGSPEYVREVLCAKGATTQR